MSANATNPARRLLRSTLSKADQLSPHLLSLTISAASSITIFCVSAAHHGTVRQAFTSTPSNPELIMWTLAGINAGLLASIPILLSHLPKPTSIKYNSAITLAASSLILTAGALGHFAAIL